MADFYEQLFRERGLAVRSIVDLACGTGTLTSLLAGRGYDMIGVDASEDMLAQAAEKAEGLSGRLLLLNQPMECLDLFGTVDAAVCSLDGINYVKPSLLKDVFYRVRLFLEPGGLFVFDIHTPARLKSLDGEVFLDETPDVFCVWRTFFDNRENACFYGMDLFERLGSKWLRSREEHVEYAYDPRDLESLLVNEGFADVRFYGDLKHTAPDESDTRIFIAASKGTGNG
ncbi:class I SAM-dependent methyltransferase [Oscillospiraceae bacterium CM]|nr:class I SAM-dependent methyltransferase [Oscillospiraceae bacterium CM]